MATAPARSARRRSVGPKLPDLLVELTPDDGPRRIVKLPDPRNEFIRHYNGVGEGTARPAGDDLSAESEALYVVYSIDAEGNEKFLSNVEPMNEGRAARFVSAFNASATTHRAVARRVERIVVGKEELPERAIRAADRNRRAERAAALAE